MTDPTIYWVNTFRAGRLAVVSRPRNAADFSMIKAAGIDVLVSLLEPYEEKNAGLADAEKLYGEAGIELVSLPVPDHGLPTSIDPVEAAVELAASHMSAGRGVGAHCYAGLGRSPLFICAVLIRQGYSGAAAIAAVSAARGCPVPEMRSQHAWLMEFARRRPG